MAKRLIRLCSNCEKESQFETTTKDETITVRKEPIRVKIGYLKCPECGDEVIDPTLNDPFKLAYVEYRKKHGLLKPEEIASWRDAYRLTQSELAKLIGVGTATLSRYENGALQEEAHDKLLRFTMEPGNLLELVGKSEGVFGTEKKERLLKALKEARVEGCSIDSAITLNFGGYDPDEFSGFKRLDMAKLYSAILFFCRKGVLKTKLNKLLFYADFRHFKDYATPITGARYAHVPFGPAPDHYELYFASLKSQGALEYSEDAYPNGYVGEILTAAREPDLSLFSTTELRIMSAVADDFDKFNATEISELSHKEQGYTETENGRLISYTYAAELK